MAAFRSLFAVFLLAVASSSSVSPVDEERAINATQLLIQRLETDMSVRIRNVSTTPRRINAAMKNIIHSISAVSEASSSGVS